MNGIILIIAGAVIIVEVIANDVIQIGIADDWLLLLGLLILAMGFGWVVL